MQKAGVLMTNSDDLLTFVTVIDSGSISAAAEQLNLTPSAVSRTLSRLEQSLETTLLNRTTRRMHLTEEGRFLLEHARIIVARMQAHAGNTGNKTTITSRTVAGERRLAIHATYDCAVYWRISAELSAY
jgi:DNA-binding transcriptional LysR family regulator